MMKFITDSNVYISVLVVHLSFLMQLLNIIVKNTIATFFPILCDDFIFADDNETNVHNTCLESIDIMKKAGFNQRKLSTNSPSLAKLTPFNLETEPFNIHTQSLVCYGIRKKTLCL